MPKETTINSTNSSLSELDVFLLQLREQARESDWQLVATKGDGGARLYQVEIRPRAVPVAEPAPEPPAPKRAKRQAADA